MPSSYSSDRLLQLKADIYFKLWKGHWKTFKNVVYEKSCYSLSVFSYTASWDKEAAGKITKAYQ